MICVSHTPLMDHVEVDPLIDREVRAQFSALAQYVADYDPELIVVFGPDHFKGFFYDLLPPFTVGIRATTVGDFDIGEGDYNVPEALALDCVRALHAADVDVAMSYRMQADHAFAQPLILLGQRVDRYSVIPIHINCAGPPLPSTRRVRALGAAVGAWAAALDLRVLILGSGGLSHDPPMARIDSAPPAVAEMLIAGRNPPIEMRRAREASGYEMARAVGRGEAKLLPPNPIWDQNFMDALGRGELDCLDALSGDELARVAGSGGQEVRTWLAAYAALAVSGKYRSEKLYYRDIPAWIVGMGIARAEPSSPERT